jgi:hypothetical protein
MTTMKRPTYAGLSLHGPHSAAYLSILEVHGEHIRPFLKSVWAVKGDNALWWKEQLDVEFHVQVMATDLPLNLPACSSCQLACPGEDRCPVQDVVMARETIQYILGEDHKYSQERPKDYEFRRLDLEMKKQMDLEEERVGILNLDAPLQKSLKRKLKKGLSPYWHRPFDAWLWVRYQRSMMHFFKSGFDILGTHSLSSLMRFQYLQKQFPPQMQLVESSWMIVLLELWDQDVISTRMLENLKNWELEAETRLAIIRKCEENFSLFIYSHDLELMVKEFRAFASFLLALSALAFGQGKRHPLPYGEGKYPFSIPLWTHS